jgi:glycine hydroxymethyltransferase
VTTTTHKTLRGPRAGLILCKKEYGKAVDSEVFPGGQGGPLMHIIAGKAIALKEAMSDEFKVYAKQVIKNAKVLAETMAENGFRVVSGGTDNHLALIDVTSKGSTGKVAQIALDHARITVNKNTIPFDKLSPFIASGIRLGSPAVTMRGMKEPDMKLIGQLITQTLADPENENNIKSVCDQVEKLTGKYPLYPGLLNEVLQK